MVKKIQVFSLPRRDHCKWASLVYQNCKVVAVTVFLDMTWCRYGCCCGCSVVIGSIMLASGFLKKSIPSIFWWNLSYHLRLWFGNDINVFFDDCQMHFGCRFVLQCQLKQALSTGNPTINFVIGGSDAFIVKEQFQCFWEGSNHNRADFVGVVVVMMILVLRH